jgi:hypothetical protein
VKAMKIGKSLGADESQEMMKITSFEELVEKKTGEE